MNVKRLAATGAALGVLVAGAALSAPGSAEAAAVAHSTANVRPGDFILVPWAGPYGTYASCRDEYIYLYQFDNSIAGCSHLLGNAGYADGWWVMRWS
jgi:hypothetical protein